MPRSDDLVPLLLQARKSLAMHQGTVLSWDSSTGTNTVEVGGTVLEDLPVLASTGTVLLAAGDVVGLLRYKSTYFVLGRIGVAGEGALAIRAATVVAQEGTTSDSWGDLATVGPTLFDVYVGSTRRCLVFVSVEVSYGDGGGGAASFHVSGASDIAPDGVQSAFSGSNAAGSLSAAAFMVLTADDGLHEGLNNFRMKFKRYVGTGEAKFRNRRIVVQPF